MAQSELHVLQTRGRRALLLMFVVLGFGAGGCFGPAETLVKDMSSFEEFYLSRVGSYSSGSFPSGSVYSARIVRQDSDMFDVELTILGDDARAVDCVSECAETGEAPLWIGDDYCVASEDVARTLSDDETARMLDLFQTIEYLSAPSLLECLLDQAGPSGFPRNFFSWDDVCMVYNHPCSLGCGDTITESQSDEILAFLEELGAQ